MKFIENLSEDRFYEFSIKHDLSSFFQSIAWKNLKEYKNLDAVYLTGVEDDNDNLIAAGLVIFQKSRKLKAMYCPRGPLLDYNNLNLLHFYLKNLEKFSKQKGAIVLNIEPPQVIRKYDNKKNVLEEKQSEIINNFSASGFKHLGFTEENNSFQLRYTSIIDLTKSETEILKPMKQSKRTALEKNELYFGVGLKDGTVDDLKYLSQFRDATSENRNFESEDISYFKHLLSCQTDDVKIKFVLAVFNPCKSYQMLLTQRTLLTEKLEVATKKERNNVNATLKYVEKHLENLESHKSEDTDICIGAAIRLYHKDTMTNLYAHVDRKYGNINVAATLNIKLALEAKQNGYQECDLFGLPSLSGPSKNYPFVKFKMELGGDFIEYIGVFYKPLSKIKYYAFNLIRKLRLKLKE